MSWKYYRNESTGETTEDSEEAANWYYCGDPVGVYRNDTLLFCMKF